MAAQEGRAEIEFLQLPAYRIGDLLAAMTGRNAEQAGRRVDDLLAAVVPVVHAFGAHDQFWIVLEVAVGRERHPVLVERDPARSGLVVLRVLNNQFGVTHGILRTRRRGGPAQSTSGNDSPMSIVCV